MPLLGPLGVEGVETVSVTEIVTESVPDQEETTELWEAHLALVFTEYVPAEAQDFEALVVPTESQPELVPSPQSKKYCTEWPRLEEEPPVE